MLKTQIPANKVNFLIHAMQDLFDTTVLEQGWHYYHRGQIREPNIGSDEVQASVRSKDTVHRVLIHLDTFPLSSCTCIDEGYCKHMAAVCFLLYSNHGRPELLLQELKGYAASRSRRSAATKARTSRNNESAAPELGNSPAQWQKFFDQQFYGYSVSNQYAAENFYQTAVEKLTELARDWETARKKLFTIHILLFVLRKLNQFYTHNSTTYLSYYLELGCQRAARQCMEQLTETLGTITPGLLFKLPSANLDQTSDVVDQLVFNEKRHAISGIDVYRLMWSGLLEQPERIDREQKKLQKRIADTSLSSSSRSLHMLALAHFEVSASADEKALQLMEKASGQSIAVFVWYLEAFCKEGRWERLHHWLRRLLPMLKHAKQDTFRVVCNYWLELTNHLGTDEEWVRVMVSLLPRSYNYYTEYLLEGGRYRQWVDLQIAHRVAPVNLFSGELKKVEAENPELLLPLYHQSAEAFVQEKNRSSYKMAIRMLKKLQAYYKILKQDERWEEFVELFAAKYSRLRAFQEELKKGKLIP